MPGCPMAGDCSPNSDREPPLHPPSSLLHCECHPEWCDSWSWFVLERTRRKPTATERDKSPPPVSPDHPSLEQTPARGAELATCPHSELLREARRRRISPGRPGSV